MPNQFNCSYLGVMDRDDPQRNSRIKFDIKIQAMKKIAEELQPNHVYMITITERIEKANDFTPYDAYVISVLAQEIAGNGTTNSNQGEGRTSI